MTESLLPPGRLSNGTECHHEGQASNYCTKCWMYLYEARQRLAQGGGHEGGRQPAPTTSVPTRYRTFWPRFWAGLVDGLVFLPLTFVDAWVYRSTAASAARAVWFIASEFLYYGYSVGMHAKFGQTLGKMAARVKVLDLSETKLSIRQALLRDAVPIVLTFVFVVTRLSRVAGGGAPLEAPPPQWDRATWLFAYLSSGWWAVEVITMLTNRRRRALHDLIASSVVVRIDSATAAVNDDSAVEVLEAPALKPPGRD